MRSIDLRGSTSGFLALAYKARLISKCTKLTRNPVALSQDIREWPFRHMVNAPHRASISYAVMPSFLFNHFDESFPGFMYKATSNLSITQT